MANIIPHKNNVDNFTLLDLCCVILCLVNRCTGIRVSRLNGLPEEYDGFIDRCLIEGVVCCKVGAAFGMAV